jgi:hypothetical protein
MRQPPEDAKLTLSQSAISLAYPARCTLVSATYLSPFVIIEADRPGKQVLIHSSWAKENCLYERDPGSTYRQPRANEAVPLVDLCMILGSRTYRRAGYVESLAN